MKKGKIVLLREDEKYSVKIGTVDNKNPKAIYMVISSWVTPIINEVDNNYDRVISNIRKSVKQNIYDNIDVLSFYNDKTIVDLDLRSSGIVKNKKSYMACEVTIFQKGEHSIKSKNINESFSVMANNIITDILDENDFFIFSRQK